MTGSGLILTGLIVTAMGVLVVLGPKARRPSPPVPAREPTTEPWQGPNPSDCSEPRDLS